MPRGAARRARCAPCPRGSPGASSETTCGCVTESSATSSMSTMRSCCGASPSSAARSVVLPVPPAPVTRRLRLAETASSRTFSCSASSMPAFASAASGKPPARGIRMERSVPLVETGGSTACTRMPLPSRTSMAGVASSMWRPPRAISRTASARTSASSAVHDGSGSGPEPRSIHRPDGPFTNRSVTGPDAAWPASGPSTARSGVVLASSPSIATEAACVAGCRVGPLAAVERGGSAAAGLGTLGSCCHDGVATNGMVMRRP